jgi:AraC-like DNA-binding protein
MLNMSAGNIETVVQFTRDPSLRYIELRYSEYSEPVFHRHNHEAYSIGLVKKGRTQFHLVRECENILPVISGDVVMINPGEVHACNPEAGTVFAYYMLYLELEYFINLASDISGIPAARYRFPVSLVKDRRISRQVNDLCRCIHSRQPGLEIETRLLETLTAILQACASPGAPEVPVQAPDHPVTAAYDYLRDHPAKAVTLKKLAEICHLSPYHFLRRFRRQYGLPPHTAQLQMRINLARRLLADSQPIADVAAVTGFADQSHFTREFKKSVGTTPQKYRLSN